MGVEVGVANVGESGGGCSYSRGESGGGCSE